MSPLSRNALLIDLSTFATKKLNKMSPNTSPGREPRKVSTISVEFVTRSHVFVCELVSCCRNSPGT